MAQLKAILALTRPVNILYIVITQVLINFLLIVPFLVARGIEPTLSISDFILLCISTSVIAAGGYIINDYFDVKIDEINKPERIKIDRGISRRAAIAAHWISAGIGIILAAYVAYKHSITLIASIQVLTVLALWYYSTKFKREFLTGNILVSTLTGLVILIVALYQWPSIKLLAPGIPFKAVTFMIVIYTVFAFLVSMIREIIKDIEDMAGDASFNCCTIPVVVGLPRTKWLIGALSILVIGMVGYFQWLALQQHFLVSPIYALFTIQFPMVFILAKLRSADTKAQFSKLSAAVKLVMLFGILSIILFRYIDPIENIFRI